MQFWIGVIVGVILGGFCTVLAIGLVSINRPEQYHPLVREDEEWMDNLAEAYKKEGIK